jgi:hypothetical protein
MLVRIVCLTLVLSLAAASAAANPESKAATLDRATQEKIRRLQLERRDGLKTSLCLRFLSLRAGQATLKDMFIEAETLLEAELELARNASERVAAHATHLEVTRRLEKVAESMFRAGIPGGTRADFQTARNACLKAEIGWLKAGGKDSKKEMKEDLLGDRALNKWASPERIKVGVRDTNSKAKKDRDKK